MLKTWKAAVFILFACLAYSCADKNTVTDAEISKVLGRHLKLANGRVVSLVGVFIPPPGSPNDAAGSFETLRVMLEGKTAQIRVVEKRHKSGYPKTELAEVFINGESVNRMLLDQGIGFFYEDHWKGGDKEIYRGLETGARAAKRGVWAYEERLKPQFVRPANGRFIHYPECHYVKDLAKEERVVYFTPVPEAPYMTMYFAYFCDYCRGRFQKGLQEPEIPVRTVKVKMEGAS